MILHERCLWGRAKTKSHFLHILWTTLQSYLKLCKVSVVAITCIELSTCCLCVQAIQSECHFIGKGSGWDVKLGMQSEVLIEKEWSENVYTIVSLLLVSRSLMSMVMEIASFGLFPTSCLEMINTIPS